ncbi:acetyl-CoA synthetase-like protein [Lichtheimia hyalospora FSU 10163]|nr:acetyl-CoA synthetase-like protein [Lichtheimia hyalospora FSU 10163]
MLSADAVSNTQSNTIYKELFESNDTRFVKDDEPLIVDAMNPHRYQTFSELKRKVRSFAMALHREPFNLQEGDVVVVCTPEDIECATVNYGVACAGCVACFVRVGVSVEEVQGVFESVSPKAAIIHPDSLSTIAAVWGDGKPDIPVLSIGTGTHSRENGKLLSLSDYIHDHVQGCLPDVDPETPAFLLHTSGTTGTPKRVNITQVFFLCELALITHTFIMSIYITGNVP